MAYQPTIADMDEVLDAQKNQSGVQYVPSLADMEEVEKSQTAGNWASNLGRGALSGLLNVGRGVSNLEAKGLHAAGVPYGKYMHQVSPAQIGQQAITPPGIAGAPSTKIGEFIGGSIPMTTMPLEGLMTGGIGSIAAKNALLGGVLGPVYNPDESVGKSALTGAAIGLVAGPAIKGATTAIPKGWNALRSLGGTASPAQIERNIEAAGETKVPLAEMIQSPFLKKSQVALSYVPGSGMSKQYMGVGESLNNRVENSLSNLEGKKDISSSIQNALKASYKDAEATKRNLYGQMNDHADKLGIKVEPSSYQNTAQQYLEEAQRLSKSSPELAELDGVSGLDNLLKTIGGTESIAPKEFKDATLTSARLNNALHDAYTNNEKYKSGILFNLKNSLDTDIENSVQSSGNPELSSMWDNAKQHYAQNVAPLESREMIKFIKGGGDADQIIPSFLKTGQYERPQLLNKLVSQLGNDDRKALAHQYLTKGLRESGDDLKMNSDKVLNAYNKLGDMSKNILFSPEEKGQLDDILHTRGLMGADINQMFIPKTGARGPTMMHLLMGAGAASNPMLAFKLAGLSNLSQRALMSRGLQNLAKGGARAVESSIEKSPGSASAYAAPALINLTKKYSNGGRK